MSARPSARPSPVPAIALAAVVSFLARGAAPESAPLRGFSKDRARREREYERRLLALPSPESLRATLRELTRTPHLAGTPDNERVGAFLAEEYRKAGLEVTVVPYDVLLSYPKTGRLALVGEPGVLLARPEEPVAGDPDSHVRVPPWNAYAASGTVEAEVVYVNRGSAADYDALARLGVDVKGKIALARYFGGYRGGKSLEAEKRGVAAMLVFSDPVDDGWFKGDVYPEGPWGNETHVQRGANVYDFLEPGDPLTPGWASTKGARRIRESEARILPKLPMLPLSARDAAEILKRLGGPAAPDGWQGVAAPRAYHVGPGARVRLEVENTREVRTIRNVIGVLRGTAEPERQVLLSNHYDAWVYGAVDPSSGTATLLELARALGSLAKEGLRPRRTLVFGAWDAEEYTLTGSTEWGEEHEADLGKNAVVCLNVDAAASGRALSASASPLLWEAIREAASDVPDPGSPSRSVADAWRESARAKGRGKNVRSYATGETDDELPVAILGSGSDYTVFFNRLGVPSADLIFDGPYGVYHSVYDDFAWMERFGDPGFLSHQAMARLAGLLALRFANADVLPLSPRLYGPEIARYADALAKGAGLAAGAEVVSALADLARAARAWGSRADAAERAFTGDLAAGVLSGPRQAEANMWLMGEERALLDPAGLPGRPWFRHLVYAPLPSYEAETLPAVREALEAGDAARARAQIDALAARLHAAR